MGNQNSLESRKATHLPKDGNEKSLESQKSISAPKQGKDAYLFKTDKDHLIGAGGFA